MRECRLLRNIQATVLAAEAAAFAYLCAGGISPWGNVALIVLMLLGVTVIMTLREEISWRGGTDLVDRMMETWAVWHEGMRALSDR